MPRTHLKNSTTRDLLWSYGSFACLAVSGILSNTLISVFYGSETLGLFNQIYAIYLIASQCSVLGIHYSVLIHIAQHPTERSQCTPIISSALLTVFVFASIAIFVLVMLAIPLAKFLDSPRITTGVRVIAPALFFFSINKVLSCALNGFRWMVAFAWVQILRACGMIGFMCCAIFCKIPGYYLPVAFLFAESLLTLYLLWCFRKNIAFSSLSETMRWVHQHIIFGFKGFFSGLSIEINSRVDILVLGFFSSDPIVGLYSFAAMLAEGLQQTLVVVKNNISPILVRLIKEQKTSEISHLVLRLHRILYPALMLIFVIIFLIFPIVAQLFFSEADSQKISSVLFILTAGIMLGSGLIPLDNTLLLGGAPGYQSFFNMFSLGVNVSLNILFIPFLGIYGAALGTSLALLFSVAVINPMLLSRTGIRVPLFPIFQKRTTSGPGL